MNNNSFSLIDLYPKYVINSKGEKKPFDENNIAKILNKETGLDMSISEKVAEDVIRKIIGLGMDEITTNYIRELVCVELTQRGMNKYRNLFARAINLENISFKLSEDFMNNYKVKKADWGPIGYFTYKRTYARLIEAENRKEHFWETIRRVVEGCYSVQKEHCMKLSLPWSDKKAQNSAQIMFHKIWEFKMSPPGRGLWMMGTEFIARHGSMALNNCGFASTADIDVKYTKAFEFVMDALMLGVGVGFDTKGAGKIKIQKPREDYFDFQLPDSREGWVEALKLTLEAYFLGKQMPKYDFSKIRPAGEPIRGFGGIASGPEPLKSMLINISKILDVRVGQKIASIDILDIMNLIGKCVVAGNVRRSAEIALGDPTDLDFITSKQDKEKLYSHRWASNNSIFAVKGLDYSFIADQIAVNGEPGVLWLENARAYSRMGDPPDNKDKKAAGVNPCITGDTLIAVADGRNAIPIKQLAVEGNDVPVYCKDHDGITVIRMMRNPRITGDNEEICEVKLDDGSSIRCTGNHKFYLRNMIKKEAIDLREGDSLILGESNDNHQIKSVRKIGYEKVYNGTVDDFHNYGIITGDEMIFTANCGEQTLESFELCCLVETFPSRHDSYEEFQETLKYAYLYSKSVTLVNTHWKETNAVMLKNRRMGISQTGIIEAFVKHGRRRMLEWCDKGYNYLKNLDDKYSDWLCIPKSIKLTTVKPSGCSVKETLVNTNKGFYRLEELGDIGGEQWQDMKDFKTTSHKNITKFYVNGKVKTRIIKTIDGNLLESSLFHRYKVYEGDINDFNPENIIWKQVKDIIKGDFLVCLLDDYKKNDEPALITIEKPYHNVKPINQPKKMSPKLAWFLGLFYGDGSVHKKGIRISFNRKHPTLVQAIAKLAKELFNIDITVDEDHCIYLNSTYLLKFFKANGILKDFSHELEVPLTIRKSSRKSILSFINGLWRADGGIHHISTWSICTVSEKFARELLILCRSVGLNIKIKAFRPSSEAFGIKDRWILQSRLMDTNKLRYVSKNLKNRFKKYDGKKYWFDIVGNIEESENYTFDISVPEGNEYNANGVVSHNTVSLLPGVTPGIHFPHSEYYIRRVRISKNSDLVEPIRAAGYHIEDDSYSENSYVIEFPIHEEFFDRSKNDVSIWEQAENAAAYQKYWSDNQVSITITFKPELEANQIKHVLECYEDKLKSVSFLPIKEHGYKQAPYEEITKEKYEELISRVKPFTLDKTTDRVIGSKFCDADGVCEVRF